VRKLWLVLLLSLLAILVVMLSMVTGFSPVDFSNFRQGTNWLLSHQNPYGELEFFGLPWFGIIFAPFALLPESLSAIIWLLLNFFGALVFIHSTVSWLGNKNRFMQSLAVKSLIVLLAPASFFALVIGQISPLIALSVVVLIQSIDREKKADWWCVPLAFSIISMKPHIVALGGILLFVELLKSRRWKPVFYTSVVFIFLIILSFLLLPDWPVYWIKAIRGGDYLGGKSGLAATGFVTFADVGIDWRIFLIFLLYTIYGWYKQGWNGFTASLILVVNFLVIPYSRFYDYVLLFLPLIYIFQNSRSIYQKTMFILVIISFILLPFTTVPLLIPVITLLGVIWVKTFDKTGEFKKTMDHPSLQP
jgi:hypothetical protein